MRGALKRRRRTEQAPAPKPPAAEAGGATTSAPPPACGLLTCPHCGLRLETLAFRCPRCLGDIPLGCSGNCRACGKAGR